MKIVIVDGKQTVELRKSEKAAIDTAARVCGDLAEWLDDEQAKEAAAYLDAVRARYCPAEQEEAAVATAENGGDQ